MPSLREAGGFTFKYVSIGIEWHFFQDTDMKTKTFWILSHVYVVTVFTSAWH